MDNREDREDREDRDGLELLEDETPTDWRVEKNPDWDPAAETEVEFTTYVG